ncbi:MAG: hypothetical protein N3D11_05165 [Candidatus Sumerlaeia bacterium]|nr:hypothetical protein [Candidatus Sumerlaeia bacterium]
MNLAARILSRPEALRRSERVTLCHRAADVCLTALNDRRCAVEFLARIELDSPGTTDAIRTRQRIEGILNRKDDCDA